VRDDQVAAVAEARRHRHIDVRVGVGGVMAGQRADDVAGRRARSSISTDRPVASGSDGLVRYPDRTERKPSRFSDGTGGSQREAREL
jgi:hypothetical protein